MSENTKKVLIIVMIINIITALYKFGYVKYNDREISQYYSLENSRNLSSAAAQVGSQYNARNLTNKFYTVPFIIVIAINIFGIYFTLKTDESSGIKLVFIAAIILTVLLPIFKLHYFEYYNGKPRYYEYKITTHITYPKKEIN